MTKQITYGTTASRTISAVIGATPIRQDAEGRYCLNDMHRAAGGEKRHQPSDFMRMGTTSELVAEISNSGNPRIKPVDLSRGRYGGTYVVDDLALTYAMWISPAFHLTVVRAFKSSRATEPTTMGSTTAPAGSSVLDILKMALASEERRLELEAKVADDAPKVALARAVMADEMTMTVRDVAKRFGLSDQRLYKVLFDRKVIFQQGESRLPYQRYVDDGSLVIRTHAVAKERVISRIHVTGKGLMLIQRLLAKTP